MAKQPSPWERFKDTYIRSAITNPLGGGGLARLYYKHVEGRTDKEITEASRRAVAAIDKKYEKAPTFQTRKGRPLDYVSPENIGRGAVTLLGTILGGVDPTFAMAPGKTAVQKIAGQGAVQGQAGIVRQGIELRTGERKKASIPEVLTDAALGVAFETGVRAPGVLRGRKGRVKDEVPEALGDDFAPVERSVPPMEPETMARVMRDPEAAGARVPEELPDELDMDSLRLVEDEQPSVQAQATANEILAPIDDPLADAVAAVDNPNTDDITRQALKNELARNEALQAEQADIIRGMESNFHMSQTVLDAVKRGDPRAPTPERLEQLRADIADQVAHETSRKFPSADAIRLAKDTQKIIDEALRYSKGNFDELTPAERLEMDATAPNPPPRDNLAYEKHTPYREAPLEPANDINLKDAVVKGVKNLLTDERGSLGDGNGRLPLKPIREFGRTHGNFVEKNVDDKGNITLSYAAQNGDHIPIRMGIDDGVAEISIDQFGTKANRLGPAETRKAMLDLMDMYPEIKRFGGFRRSGAGKGRVQEVEPKRGFARLMADERGSLGDGKKPPEPANDVNVHSIADARQKKELTEFHSKVMDNIAMRSHQLKALGEYAHKSGLLPFKRGDRFTTPKGREMGQGPWKVVGYYVDPKNPERYGYRVERGTEGVDYESSQLLVSDPAADAKFKQMGHEFDREADVSGWRKLGGKLRDILDDESGAFTPWGKKNKKPKLEDIPEADLTPPLRVAKALKQASPLQREQEHLYKAERAKRFAEAKKVKNYLQGEDGYRAELSKLGGELPRVPSLASIRNHLSQDEIHALYNEVRDHPKLGYTDTLAARSGLKKILGNDGVVIPTKSEIDALGKVFPDIAEHFNRITASSFVADVINIPRSIMASTDLSAPLRQGLPLIHRKEYWNSFGRMFGQLRKKGFEASQAEIEARPTYPMMEEYGLALTDLNARLMDREEQFMSKFAESLPVIGRVIKASNQAYVGFLNRLRADTFDSMVLNAREAGKKLTDREISDIAKFINTATGRGDLNDLIPKVLRGERFDANTMSPVLSGTLFSPRLMASRVAMLNPAYYIKLKGPARKEALKSLMAYTGFVGSVITLASMAGLDVETDPRSTDFAKIRDGDVRYDITAGFQPYVRTAAQLVMGEKKNIETGEIEELNTGEFGGKTKVDQIGTFLKNKEAPIVAFAHDMLNGQDRDFNKLDLSEENRGNVTNRVGQMFVPMIVQDMKDLHEAQGNAGVARGFPIAVFGGAVQTYLPDEEEDSEFAGDFTDDFDEDFDDDFEDEF